MKIPFIMAALISLFSNSPHDIDFGKNSFAEKWVLINDNVMGGKSAGSFNVKDNYLHFTGMTSLENNGGFSKIRSENIDYSLDAADEITIRLKGDGRKYTFLFDTSVLFFRPSYWHDIQTKEGEWQEITMKTADFYETKMGNPTGKKISKRKLKKVKRIGFIIYDKKAGPFDLKIDYIKFK